MTFLIASIIVLLTFVTGALLAWAFKGIDNAVITTKEEIEIKEKAYNPALTLGYRINSQAESYEQVKEARQIAAEKAAAMPRGANMRIGWKENEEDLKLKSAIDGVEEDPWTAAKIAQFYGWDGAKTGMPAGGIPEAGAVAAPAAAAPTGKIELVPGKDYPVIEITDDMPPEEVRKARIANARAKSAAVKQAKAAGAAAPAAAAPVTAVQQQAPAVPDPVAVGIEPPKLIEITDDMPPDEIRKARIANSKARSAFNKSLKAAGIDPKTVEIDEKGNIVMPEGASLPTTPAAPAQPAPVPAAAPQQASGPVDLASLGITPPQLTKITDDMEPDDIRKARISNSKARSAFNKSLKEAGIDPKTVEIDESGNVVMPQADSPTPVAPAEAPPKSPQPSAPAQSDGEVDLAALGIEKPELIELTDDLSPDEKRQARISNSKARSAFNKALKEAGIDPKTVKL